MAYVADRSRVVIVWSCYGWRVVIESQATIESDTENSHRVCHGQVDISDWYRRQRRIYSILGVHWWCTMEIDALTARVFIPFIKFRICITSFFDHPFHKRSVAFCGRRTTALADAFITRTKWTCRRREDNTRNLDATGRSKDAADSAHRVARDQSTWKPFLRLAKRERERESWDAAAWSRFHLSKGADRRRERDVRSPRISAAAADCSARVPTDQSVALQLASRNSKQWSSATQRLPPASRKPYS